MPRIAKVLAQHGVASRRQAESLIYEGRVQINGVVLTTPAYVVTEKDHILIDNQPLGDKLPTRVWIFHKPPGVVTTHRDPQGRPTLFSLLPPSLPRVISVGRLDLMSEGLILLTTSGELARLLEHPRSAIPRTYKVRLYGRINLQHLKQIQEGITIEGITYAGIKVEVVSQANTNAWVEMVLWEGKNREIRKIMDFFGYKVNRLIRTAYGPYKLNNLKVRELQEVDPVLIHTNLPSKANR